MTNMINKMINNINKINKMTNRINKMTNKMITGPPWGSTCPTPPAGPAHGRSMGAQPDGAEATVL